MAGPLNTSDIMVSLCIGQQTSVQLISLHVIYLFSYLLTRCTPSLNCF